MMICAQFLGHDLDLKVPLIDVSLDPTNWDDTAGIIPLRTIVVALF